MPLASFIESYERSVVRGGGAVEAGRASLSYDPSKGVAFVLGRWIS